VVTRSGLVRRRDVPHVLLSCFPNYADVAARDLSSASLIKADFIAKADTYFG